MPLTPECGLVGRVLRHGACIVLLTSIATLRVDAATEAHFRGAMELSHDGITHLIRKEPSGPACELQCLLKTAPHAPGSLAAKYFTEGAAVFLDATSFYWRCVQAYRQRDLSSDAALDSKCSESNFNKGVRWFLTKRGESELAFDEWPGFLQQVATAGNVSFFKQSESLGKSMDRAASDRAGESTLAAEGVQTVVKAQFAAHLGTLFAARQAYVALGSLRPCAVHGVLKKISQQLTKLLASIRASLPSCNAAGPWTHGWRSSIIDSERLFSYLKTPEVTSLLGHAEGCARPFNFSGLTSELRIEQRARVHPPLPAISNDSVIMLRGPGGVPTAMPLLGLGTGYDDCFRGFLLKPEVLSVESADETMKVTTEKCHPITVPEDWSTNSRFSLVDTAALYGTERAIGTAMAEALRRPGRSRKDFFVVTKPPTKAMWGMLGVNNSTAYLDQQLKDLQTDYADVLLHHHDEFQAEVWAAMESAVAEGRGRMLGVSGRDQAEDVADCVHDRRGCKIMPAIAEMDFNPCSGSGIQKLYPQAQRAKVTILGTGVVWPCLREPHIAAIAQRHGVSSAAVSVRFALQNGVPSLVQTHKTSHFRAATKAMEINLSDLEMAHIWILPLLYRFNTPDGGSPIKESFADAPGLRALGIESSRALGF